MKNPKKLTYRQKVFVSNNLLDANEWMLIKEDTNTLEIINKHDSSIKTIKKAKHKMKNTNI